MGEETDQAEEEGLGELIGRLIANIRSFVSAKVDLLQAICAARLKAFRMAAIALAAGIILCLSAFTSFLVGLIIGLAPVIGPFVSTMVIGLGATAVGAMVIAIAARAIGQHLSVSIADALREEPVEEPDAAAE